MKTKIGILFAIGFIWGCTDSSGTINSVPNNTENVALDVEDDSSPSQNCSVSQAENGVMITCPDGTQAYVENGKNGQDGSDGADGAAGNDGKDGSSCTIVTQSPTSATISCSDGSVSELNLAVPIADTIGGLVLWLDAADKDTIFKNKNCTSKAADGNEVLCWKDKADNLKVLARSDKGPRYEVAGAALDFRSNSDESMEAKLKERLSGDDYTVFMVANIDVPASDSDGRFLTLLGNGVGNELGSGTSSVPLRRNGNSNELISSQKNSNTSKHQADPAGLKIFSVSLENGETIQYQDSDGTNRSKKLNKVDLDVDRVRIMNGSDRFGQGDVHEILVYDRKLTQSEYVKVYTQLLLKWGL